MGKVCLFGGDIGEAADAPFREIEKLMIKIFTFKATTFLIITIRSGLVSFTTLITRDIPLHSSDGKIKVMYTL